jgi:hypothetical protein
MVAAGSSNSLIAPNAVENEADIDGSRETDVENDESDQGNDESDQEGQQAGLKQEDSGSDEDSDLVVAEIDQGDNTAPDLPDDADGGQESNNVAGDEQPIQEEDGEEVGQQEVMRDQREHPLPPSREYNLNIRDQV